MMVRVASELEANIVSVERIQEFTEISQEVGTIFNFVILLRNSQH